MTDTQEYVATEETSLPRLRSDLKTWAADVEAGRRVDSPVDRAKVELRVSELELAEAEAKVIEVVSKIEGGAGSIPSSTTLAAVKATTEHARGVVKGRQAALARAVDAERVAALTALSVEAQAYAAGDVVPAIAAALQAAVENLNEYQRLIQEHNLYVDGLRREAKSLGVTSTVGPAVPDPATGGITLDKAGRLQAGKHHLNELNEVALFARAKTDEGVDSVVTGILDSVNAVKPDPRNIYFRDGKGSSRGYPQGAEPGPVQQTIGSLVELDYDTEVWPR